MAEERQYDNMVGKPLFDILSKLPSKSLLRFRCVCKLWREYIDDSYFVSVHDKQVIEDSTAIIYYLNETEQGKTFCFHTLESDTITNHVLKAKSNPVKISFYEPRFAEFVGSCNGLVLIEADGPEADDLTPNTFTVYHPINKQCYVLPELPLCCYQDLCGLGFDSSTNTFKMVYVYGNPQYPHTRCTIVHVSGTNSWRYIPNVPSYETSGNAIFAHGCLHWLVSYNQGEDGTRQVIWFDVKSEEFGLIKPPKTKSVPSKRKYRNTFYDHLVDLYGQVGYFGNKTTEVWVLNDKKEWVLHCNFEDYDFPDGYIEVLGCLNKAGDILIKLYNWGNGIEMFYIYNLKNRVMHEAHIHGLDMKYGSEMGIVMIPNSLFDVITNSNLFKKKSLKKT